MTTAQAADGGGQAVTLCFVPRPNPRVERTVHVPDHVAARLIRTTLSYRRSPTCW